MVSQENNFAYIDGANLYKGVKELGWLLDYRRFRIWLKDKYDIKNAYLFIGFVPKYKNLYINLQEAGFILVYKQVTYNEDGIVKGNCDAALVLRAVSDFYEQRCDEIVIVSSDGDYAELVEFLKRKNVLRILVSPSSKCSYLLRQQNIPLLYLDTQRNILEERNEKEKAPDRDRTL